MSDRSLPLVHVIAGLGVGGAENFLLTLLTRLNPRRFVSRVVSLKGPVAESQRFRVAGIRVDEMGGRWRSVRHFWELLRSPGGGVPAPVVHCWMYHANVLGGVAARVAGNRRVIWGLRQTNLSARFNKITTRGFIRAGALLSRSVPRYILCNSQASREAHQAVGYSPSRLRVIPNGVDCAVFFPQNKKDSGRDFFGIPFEARRVGVVARWDPVKGHAVLFEAMARLTAESPVHWLMCGPGMTADNKDLRRLADRFGVGSRCHWMGPVENMPDFYSHLDLFVSSSLGESFPNALAEALACGVPCVSTEVGESRSLVGETGWLIPPGDSEKLAAALTAALAESPESLARRGAETRARILERFDLSRVVSWYEDLYDAVAADRPWGGPVCAA